MAFCVNCGKQVPDGAGFCPGCGASAAAVQAGSGARPVSQGTASQSAVPPVRRKSKALPIVIVAVVVVVVAVAALVLINPFGSKDGSGGTGVENGLVGSLEQPVVPPIENVGDRVEFGIWHDKPITWRVLAVEDDRALVITEDILAVRPYDDLGVSSSGWIQWDDISTTWAESDIRAWLNDEFLNTVFTWEAQEAINLSQLSNPDNPEKGIEGGANTEDRVFLLSIDEANRYFSGNDERGASIMMTEEDVQYMLRISKDYGGDDRERLLNMENSLRDYYLGQSKAYWWWLRSPGIHGSNAAGVDSDGSIYGDGFVRDFAGIRPALWLNL